MPRRERGAIMGNILTSIEECQMNDEGGRVRLTHVAKRANVAYDRLVAYVTHLKGAGLVNGNGEGPMLTDQGRRFLSPYRAWVGAIQTLGLDAPVMENATAGLANSTD